VLSSENMTLKDIYARYLESSDTKAYSIAEALRRELGTGSE